MVAPTPFKTVRRGTCFLLDEHDVVSFIYLLTAHNGTPCCVPCAARTLHRLRHAAHPELVALDHRLNDGRKFVILRRRVAHDLADGRHVVVLARAAHRIGQKVFHKRLHELVGTAQQRLAEIVGPVDLRAVGQFAGGIDGRAGKAVLVSPHSGRVEVFEREAERIHHRVARRAGRARAMLRHQLADGERFGRADVLVIQGRDAGRRVGRRDTLEYWSG